MNRTHFNFALILVLFFIISIATFSCNKETYNYKENGIKSIKQTEKTSKNRTKRKYIEYKKITPWNYRDTIPYDNCYIIIEKDSLFYYYKEGKLEEVRRMIIDSFYRYKTFHFKEKSDDILQFSHSNDTVHLLRDSYDGKTEYFIFDKEYDEACQ